MRSPNGSNSETGTSYHLHTRMPGSLGCEQYLQQRDLYSLHHNRLSTSSTLNPVLSLQEAQMRSIASSGIPSVWNSTLRPCRRSTAPDLGRPSSLRSWGMGSIFLGLVEIALDSRPFPIMLDFWLIMLFFYAPILTNYASQTYQ